MANLESLKFGLCFICKSTHCITDLTTQIFIFVSVFQKTIGIHIFLWCRGNEDPIPAPAAATHCHEYFVGVLRKRGSE